MTLSLNLQIDRVRLFRLRSAMAFTFVLSIGLCAGITTVASQTTGSAGNAAPMRSASSPVIDKKPLSPTTSGPAWKELTPEQQTSLSPLNGSWDRMSESHKRKWIAISRNYQSLAEPDRNKLHSRMREWASLSPQQREQARINFAETAKLSPTEKAATWQAYQALPAEEKQKLAVKAVPTPAGAAVATKPVAPEKLATVPLTRQKASAAASSAPRGSESEAKSAAKPNSSVQ